jgi:hypothetical protein
LAIVALWDLFSHGAHSVVSTTVAAPIRNLASIPFIEYLGGTPVGQLPETYPEIGELLSTIWLFTVVEARRRLRENSVLGKFLAGHVAAVLGSPSR